MKNTGAFRASNSILYDTFKSLGMYCKQAAFVPVSPASALNSLSKLCFSLLRSSTKASAAAAAGIVALRSILLCAISENPLTNEVWIVDYEEKDEITFAISRAYNNLLAPVHTEIFIHYLADS